MRLVRRIRARAAQMEDQTDARLQELLDVQRQRLLSGADMQHQGVMQEVFAIVSEGVRRCLGMQFYDVQLLAGIVLTTGAVAEMKTGEGKTLVTALPAVMGGLAPGGVHVATVNSYLAKRDFEWLRPVFDLLGLSSGLLQEGDSPETKRAAYASDLTYGTGYEFGFDYLRDQIALQTQTVMPLGREFLRQLRGGGTTQNTVQGPLAFAIIDEVDSVLIDEANTPLVISGPAHGCSCDPQVYLQADDLASQLEAGVHYQVGENRQIELTETGLDRVFAEQPDGILRPWSVYLEQALRAQLLMQRDVEYVVSEDIVKIVDQYTGRIFDERTWRDGLHQAVEAKEKVAITEERRSLAQVSRQRFYQQYDVLCGMTGTALGHEAEFERFYQLPIVAIPLRKPCQRQRMRSRFFCDAATKLDAVAEQIAEIHATQRPVLVGTRTIEVSRNLATRLDALHLPHKILNGVQDEEEAAVIAQAGEVGAITIATNMAGRGTDIKLTAEAKSAGGLHVIAMEFHDSVRIDRQLEGRAARQGDPGSSQFFAAADDELFEKHDPKIASLILRSAADSKESKRSFDRVVQRIQTIAERDGFAKRCRLYQQQHWMEQVLSTIAEPTQKHKHPRQGAVA